MKTIVSRALCALAVVGVAGCNNILGIDDLTQSGADAATDAAPGTARVRILNVARALPGAGLVDVYVGDEATPRLPALAGLSDYMEVAPGVDRIAIRAQGQSGGAPLFDFDGLVFTPDVDTTAILTGIATSQNPDEAVRLLQFTEAFAQAGTAMTQVRFVNAIEDLADVSVDIGLYGEQSPELSGLARFEASAAAGMSLPSSVTYRFGVVAGGTTIAAFGSEPLPVGVGCFVVLYGNAQAPRNTRDALGAATACRTTTTPTAYRSEQGVVAHFLADVPAGTLASLKEVPGDRVVGSVDLRQFTRFWVSTTDAHDLVLQFPSQTLHLDISPDFADQGKLLSIVGGALQPLSGDVDVQPQLLLLPPVPTSGARAIYFFSAAVDLSQYSIIDETNRHLVDNLEPGQLGGPSAGNVSSTLDAGSHQLSIDSLDLPGGTAVRFPFTVTGSGGATLFVIDGAITPQGSQRPLRVVPIDLGVWPPTVGTVVVPS